MTNFIATNPDHEDEFFINSIKINVAKKYNVCQSKVHVFFSDEEGEYCIYVDGVWSGYYQIDNYDLEDL